MNPWTQRVRRKLRVWLHAISGYQEDSAGLGRAANRFWNDFSSPARAQEAHWRGHGPFADDAVWLKLGRDHLTLLQRTLQVQGQPLQAHRVVEWGCGGGMNAVHFARGAQAYHGVDVSRTTLDECARQMVREGLAGFVPVLVDGNAPRAALAQIEAPCDLFICTYVMELLPTKDHALLLLKIGAELLIAGGHALIHIRCTSGTATTRSRPWDYASNMAHNVTFSLAEFRAACESVGFTVLTVEEKPTVPELREKDYAYFVLQRRGG